MASVEQGRVAALLRVVHAIAHDLSNPLQTLLMHATMALDDAPEGSEEAMALDANLGAVGRMRTILRALTGLATAGVDPRPLTGALERFADLLRPRFERLGVRVEVEPPHAGDNAWVGAETEETLLSLGVALAATLRRDPGGVAVVQLSGAAAEAMEIRVALLVATGSRRAVLEEVAAAIAPVGASVRVVVHDDALVLHAERPRGGVV